MSIRIDDIAQCWERLCLERVDLMKINIEGAEYALLERMIETGLTERVGSFMIQFHEWHPGAYRRRRKVRQALAETHSSVWNYDFVWEKWDRRESTMNA